MAHDLNVLIGRIPIDLEKVSKYGLAVAIENDFAIIFLDQYHLQRWNEILNLSFSPEIEEMEFGGELVHFFAEELGLEVYVVARLEYSFYGTLYKSGGLVDAGQITRY